MAYNTDIEYTDKFYPEWSLSNLRLQCALKGIEMPKIDQACELGFGQGVTLNLLASTSEVSWYGTDFLQVHVDNAKTMAHELDNDVKLYNLSFKDFSEVKNLPKFDLIVLHGILVGFPKRTKRLFSILLKIGFLIMVLCILAITLVQGVKFLSPRNI